MCPEVLTPYTPLFPWWIITLSRQQFQLPIVTKSIVPPNHEDRVVILRFVVQWVTIKNLIYELRDIGASNFFNRPIITNKKEPHTCNIFSNFELFSMKE